jgi:hypothetical protein
MFILTKSGAAIRYDFIYQFNIEEVEEGDFHIFCYEIGPEVPIEYSIDSYPSFEEAYKALSELIESINKQFK